jgi:ribosomal 50S subunit-recycling heat shock protein
VEVNGKPVKASYDVKPGDTIAVNFGANRTEVKVLAVKETVRKEEAATLYRVKE